MYKVFAVLSNRTNHGLCILKYACLSALVHITFCCTCHGEIDLSLESLSFEWVCSPCSRRSSQDRLIGPLAAKCWLSSIEHCLVTLSHWCLAAGLCMLIRFITRLLLQLIFIRKGFEMLDNQIYLIFSLFSCIF